MPDADAVARRRAGALADVELVLRTRSGDSIAYEELWRRHLRSGIAVARSISPGPDADCVVREVYTRAYKSIVAGDGPTGSFRAYLFTCIRDTAEARGREQAEVLDQGRIHEAFRRLPARWQEVLWYSEIEEMKPAEIAPLLGVNAVTVTHMTSRAREALRRLWLQAELESVDDPVCRWTIEHLDAHPRGGFRDRARVQAHLSACERCTEISRGAREVGSRLALVVLPLTVGVGATVGYLASLRRPGRSASRAVSAIGLAAAMVVVATTIAAAVAQPPTDQPTSRTADASQKDAATRLPHISLSDDAGAAAPAPLEIMPPDDPIAEPPTARPDSRQVAAPEIAPAAPEPALPVSSPDRAAAPAPEQPQPAPTPTPTPGDPPAPTPGETPAPTPDETPAPDGEEPPPAPTPEPEPTPEVEPEPLPDPLPADEPPAAPAADAPPVAPAT